MWGFATIGSGTALISTDTDGTSTWSTGPAANGVPIMTAQQYQSGRVVVLTDIGFIDSTVDNDADGDSNFFDSDNERLIVNSFQWLSESSTSSINGGNGGGGDSKKGAPIPWLIIAGIVGGIVALIAIAAIIMKLRSKGS